jgi:hypothetical protein
MTKLAPALLLISLGLTFVPGGCGPGLEPPKASEPSGGGPRVVGFAGSGASAAGTNSVADGHAGSAAGNAGHAGAAGHAPNDAGVEDDGGS